MLLLDAHDRLKMGLEGRRKVLQTFDEKLIIQQYLKTLEDIGLIAPAKKAKSKVDAG